MMGKSWAEMKRPRNVSGAAAAGCRIGRTVRAGRGRIMVRDSRSARARRFLLRHELGVGVTGSAVALTTVTVAGIAGNQMLSTKFAFAGLLAMWILVYVVLMRWANSGSATGAAEEERPSVGPVRGDARRTKKRR